MMGKGKSGVNATGGSEGIPEGEVVKRFGEVMVRVGDRISYVSKILSLLTHVRYLRIDP